MHWDLSKCQLNMKNVLSISKTMCGGEVITENKTSKKPNSCQ